MKSNIIKGIIVVGILLVLVFFQRKFFPKIETTTTIDTFYQRYDSIIYKDKPIPYEVQLPPDTIKIPADTAKLVQKYLALHKDYYTTRKYADTIKIDTIGDIKVYQEVNQNKLSNFTVDYSLVSPKIIKTTTTVIQDKGFYVGGIVGKQNISPMLTYTTGKYNYFVSYNFIRSEVNIGMGIKLNKIKLW